MILKTFRNFHGQVSNTSPLQIRHLLCQRRSLRTQWTMGITDADNAITNKIYQRIGYRLVTAFSEVTFAA